MQIWQIVSLSLGLFLAYSFLRRAYYAVRYPGRYNFDKHLFLLNAEEHGKIAACVLSTLATSKMALDAAKSGSYPREFVEMIEANFKSQEKLFKAFNRRIYISPTFKQDFPAFQEKQEKKLKMLMEQAQLAEVKIPEDVKKGN